MAEDDITTRRAVADDADAIVELWKGFVSELEPLDARYGAKPGAYEKWRDYFLKRMVDASHAALFVAADGDDVVGVIEARVMGGHPVFRVGKHGQLFGHYVASSHRGAGVGHRLVEAAEAWFRDQGLPYYRIVVLDHFSGLGALYEELGMERAECTYEKFLDA